MARHDNDGYGVALMIVGVTLLAHCVYYGGYGFLRSIGWTSHWLDLIVALIRQAGLIVPLVHEKALALLLFCMGVFLRGSVGTPTVSLATSCALFFGGLVIYLIGTVTPLQFVLATVLGFSLAVLGAHCLWRHTGLGGLPADPMNDTFKQCGHRIRNAYSINIRTRYQHKGRFHRGWINVVNPFRGTLILGTPGSGKSYSVYGPFIEQMIAKGYSMFVYDYKYPDLTKMVYNELVDHLGSYKVKPKFYTIDFAHPDFSNRCNPMAARYINDPADSAEVAEVIMLNISPGKEQKNDFFDMSAKVYLDCLIWFLRKWKDGRYCTFPHLVEMTARDYRDVLNIMFKIPELEVKIAPFLNALSGGAQDQLQGQIASATIPLAKFASPELYWVLSGDDFSLDINDPSEPKIVCVGNDPKRQAIYGTTLALYTSRLCKTVNEKGKLHSGVLLDELPTIFVKGLDNLIATARSNKVAVVLGAQDKSQLVRDYGQKESDVIFNTVGNIFAGQVNGKTAQDLSRSFGKEFRDRRSQSYGQDSRSETLSRQLEDRLPVSMIETLTQGVFCGKTQDDNGRRNDYKFFCGEIQRPKKKKSNDHWSKRPPVRMFEGDMKEEIQENFTRIKLEVEEIIHMAAEEYGIILEADKPKPLPKPSQG